jgi:hypothetical protein
MEPITPQIETTPQLTPLQKAKAKYYLKNKETISTAYKTYYETNKDDIARKRRERYARNKEERTRSKLAELIPTE